MAVALRTRITAREREHLQRLRGRSVSRAVWARATAILLAAGGMRTSEVAAMLAVTETSVANWKRRWRTGGVRVLLDAPRTGRPPLVTRAYRQLLREAVARGPQAFGYVFTVWSCARLAEHMRRRTRIAVTEDWVRRLLHNMGYAFRRPKHSLHKRQNRRKVRAARTHLERLKKGLCATARHTNFGSRTKRISTFIPI